MMKRVVTLTLLAVSALGWSQLYPSKTGILGTASLRLTEPQYQTELKINEDQAKEISSAFLNLNESQEKLSQEITKAKPEQYAAIQKRQEKLEQDTAAKVISVLSQYQKSRLMELALQDTGPWALRNADIAKRVGLTNEQRLKVNALASKTIATLDEVHAKMGAQLEAAPQGKSGDKKREAIVRSFEPRLKQIDTQSEAQVLAILTVTQRQTWKKALGAPFTR